MDITERLRALYVEHGTNYVQEAADEIERLRASFSETTNPGARELVREARAQRDNAVKVAIGLQAYAVQQTTGLQALREWLLPRSDGLARIIGERIDALLAKSPVAPEDSHKERRTAGKLADAVGRYIDGGCNDEEGLRAALTQWVASGEPECPETDSNERRCAHGIRWPHPCRECEDDSRHQSCTKDVAAFVAQLRVCARHGAVSGSWCRDAADLIERLSGECHQVGREDSLAWYGEQAAAIAKYSAEKNTNAMMAVVVALTLDAGKRAGYESVAGKKDGFTPSDRCLNPHECGKFGACLSTNANFCHAIGRES